MWAPVVIAGKDLRQRLRDRSAIVLGLIAPLGIAALMSLAFRGVESVHATVGVVDLDHGPLATAFLDALHQPGLRQIVTARRLDGDAQARRAVRDGSVGAAIVIPPGFSAAATSGRPEPMITVTSVNATIAGQIVTSVTSSFAAQLNADRLSVATASAAAPGMPPGGLAAEAAGLRIPVPSVTRSLGAHPLKPISYYAPGMAIFFLLFTITFTARSYFVDRAQGMLERMRVAPLHPTEILAGKALSVLVYGVASLGVIAVVTSAAFGANWGDPLAAAVLSLAMVVSVVCLTALVIGLARSERQAEGIAALVVFGLALLGGNFVFVASAPPVMQRLALLTPNGWALRGFTDLATTGGGLGVVVAPVVAILAFSAVVGTAAALLAGRAVSA